MINVDRCVICAAASSYIERTLFRGPYSVGWFHADRVYAARAYCPRHFFLLREMLKEAEDMLAEQEKVTP